MSLFWTETALGIMLDAAMDGDNPSVSVTHVGAYDAGTALTSVTGVASTDVFTKTSHGMADGTVVKLTSLSGGTGLNVNKWYFVRDQAANTFKLAPVPAGTAVDFSVDVSAVTVTPYLEISGGSYARQVIAFNAAGTHADGATIDDSTNGAVIPIPAGATVDAISGHSASSAGTLLFLDDVTPEAFGGAGTYTVTDVDGSLSVT
ncbi:MAG TPA: hypothetical protein VI341_13630 [Actinomycetota bacterium]